METPNIPQKMRLPLLPSTPMELNIEEELAKYETEQRALLGLVEGKEHWRDEVPSTFTATQRAHTTLLVSGLTMAHDYFIEGALSGIGYNVKNLDCPDNDALRFGKEFGNRGQCNPTYFTVGNLVKFLSYQRDIKHVPTKDIINNYVFVTAGACGPCRFGTYVTEYRKALRDSGFDGFRVLLFQQTGGLKQATGEDLGLKMNAPFFIGIVKAIMTGDVLNALAYRIRPYEVEPGSTNAAIERCKEIVHKTLLEKNSLLVALVKCRKELSQVKVNRLNPKPKVSIIGEFWAMTTEGDGNYQLQKFLEQEGAEPEIQLVTAWLLYMLWGGKYDTKQRMLLRNDDGGKRGLKGKNPVKTLATLWVAEKVLRGMFQGMANLMGLHGYHLPDMDEVARVAHEFYNNELRGGEGHMEVGKLIMNAAQKKAHMTLSVKPFGCMPSSGVSDGVQSLITERYPDTIFCPIETNGDGAVNVYSRVQMMLFKARKAARLELENTLEKYGVTLEEVKAYAEKHGYMNPLHKSPHVDCGTAADLVHEVAPKMRGVTSPLNTLKRFFGKGTKAVSVSAN